MNENEHKMTQEEAEKKVAEMFAAASAARKAPKKSRRSYDDISAHDITADNSAETPSALLAAAKAAPNLLRGRLKSDDSDLSGTDGQKLSHKDAEKKVAEILALTDTAESRDNSSLYFDEILPSSGTDEKKLSPQEAEEKIAEILTLASNSQKIKEKGTLSSLVFELTVLELLSFFLFFASMSSGVPGPLTPIAILLPVIVGIGIRVFRQQLTLREAVSNCKPHLILCAFFYICLLFSV